MSATAADGSGGSVVRDSRVMALGTVASRLTGFARNAALVAVLGLGLTKEAYDVANVLPNFLYELLLGAVVTSTVVPLLVAARRRDDDGGDAYARALLTLVAVGLGLVSVVSVLLAPVLVDVLNSSDDPAQRDLAVDLARFLLPQVVFYGLSATAGAVLNSRGSFAAPMWAPVLNNLVVVATCGAFLLLGPAGPTPDGLTTAQVVVLGAGTTAGIVVMTAALVPALRRVGLPLRPRFQLRGLGLRRAARLASWVLLYVSVSLGGAAVGVALLTGVGDYAVWTAAYVLYQLPHAVVAVSVITALLPRMAGSAVEDRLDLVAADVTRGTRLAASLLVPAAAGAVVLGPDAAVLVYGWGAGEISEARRVGAVLGLLAVGLVPFSLQQLQSRAFYALPDTRTPALVQVGLVAVLVTGHLTAAAVLDDGDRVLGMAAAHALAYLVGFLGGRAVLSRRLGHPVGGGRDVAGRLVPCALPGALLALGASVLLRGTLGDGPAGSAAALAVGGLLLAVTYLPLVLRVGRVPEAAQALGLVRSKVGR